jgi:hypothetical protein
MSQMKKTCRNKSLRNILMLQLKCLFNFRKCIMGMIITQKQDINYQKNH